MNDQFIDKALVNLKLTSSSGKNVEDTKQLQGEASKDSLFGSNETTEYSTSFSVDKSGGKKGGMPLWS